MKKNELCRGEIWAIERFPKTGKEIRYDLGSNIIVTVASDLMAELMRGIIGDNIRIQVDGIRTLAVGTGKQGWPLQAPDAATASQTYLFNELARKEFESVNYINSHGSVTNDRTNIIDLTTVFDTNEANGAIVEMGLFGGANATIGMPTPGGTMVNYYTMPVINKSSGSSITFVWRLSF